MLGSSFPTKDGSTPMPKTKAMMQDMGAMANNMFIHTPICKENSVVHEAKMFSFTFALTLLHTTVKLKYFINSKQHSRPNDYTVHRRHRRSLYYSGCPSRSELLSGRYFHNIKTTNGGCMHVDELKVNNNTFARWACVCAYQIYWVKQAKKQTNNQTNILRLSLSLSLSLLLSCSLVDCSITHSKAAAHSGLLNNLPFTTAMSTKPIICIHTYTRAEPSSCIVYVCHSDGEYCHDSSQYPFHTVKLNGPNQPLSTNQTIRELSIVYFYHSDGACLHKHVHSKQTRKVFERGSRVHCWNVRYVMISWTISFNTYIYTSVYICTHTFLIIKMHSNICCWLCIVAHSHWTQRQIPEQHANCSDWRGRQHNNRGNNRPSRLWCVDG